MVIDITSVLRKLNGKDTAPFHNVIYGQALWKSLNNTPNTFRGLGPYPYQHVLEEVCDNCMEIIKGGHFKDGEKIICSKCHDDSMKYTSKW